MQKLINLSDVNTNTKEGRYLMAALAKITTESQTDKTPYEVLEQCYLLQEEMYKDAFDIPDPNDKRPTFFDALQTLINQYSVENGSNTPDFILANFMFKALINFDDAVKHREKWYGRDVKTDIDTLMPVSQ
jgi:hypothetical protein